MKYRSQDNRLEVTESPGIEIERSRKQLVGAQIIE